MNFLIKKAVPSFDYLSEIILPVEFPCDSVTERPSDKSAFAVRLNVK